MLIKFGNGAICVDSTHSTNQIGFLLVTILIVDEFGKGVPVAWFITKSEEESQLKKFFIAIKER